jgi:hypothetical protein
MRPPIPPAPSLRPSEAIESASRPGPGPGPGPRPHRAAGWLHLGRSCVRRRGGTPRARMLLAGYGGAAPGTRSTWQPAPLDRRGFSLLYPAACVVQLVGLSRGRARGPTARTAGNCAREHWSSGASACPCRCSLASSCRTDGDDWELARARWSSAWWWNLACPLFRFAEYYWGLGVHVHVPASACGRLSFCVERHWNGEGWAVHSARSCAWSTRRLLVHRRK